MKAITLHQPWATLIAIGAKKYATRGWKLKYRGLIAIHAGSTPIKGTFLKGRDWLFEDVLQQAGYTLFEDEVSDELHRLPFGAVVAVANLTACLDAGNIRHALTQQEREFGNFDSNRWAWRLDDVTRFHVPVPAKGKQGIWEWNDAVDAPSPKAL